MNKIKKVNTNITKADYYEVLFEEYYEPTEEEVLIYKALYDLEKFGDEAIWMRSKDVFEEVEQERETVPRFEFVCYE